jgi:hypothetical protein
MSFKEDVQKFSSKVLQNKNFVKNEESTKQALIIPFINLLGYDTTDPTVFHSEYSAGFDKEKEKVDYAILKSGKIIFLVEAKPVNDPLIVHDKQLAKYFNSTREVKFAIITNGVKYYFYSDLNYQNMLDEAPFFVFDFNNIQDNDINILQHFCNDEFEIGRMIRFAEELAYSSKMKPIIIELLRNPSDELIRLIIKKIDPEAKILPHIVNRYRETTTNSIKDALIEIFRQGIVLQKTYINKDNEISVSIPKEVAISGDTEKICENSKVNYNTKLPKMDVIFEWGLISIGDVVYLKNHPQEKAKVINKKEVEYKGKILTFNQWGLQITGWKSICIYDWLILEGATETLSVLRRNRMLKNEN